MFMDLNPSIQQVFISIVCFIQSDMKCLIAYSSHHHTQQHSFNEKLIFMLFFVTSMLNEGIWEFKSDCTVLQPNHIPLLLNMGVDMFPVWRENFSAFWKSATIVHIYKPTNTALRKKQGLCLLKPSFKLTISFTVIGHEFFIIEILKKK